MDRGVLGGRTRVGAAARAGPARSCGRMLDVIGQDGGPGGSSEAAGRELASRSYLIRPAGQGDLAAIADFEVEIARVSFGDEAIADAAFHRRRVAASLGKPGEITLVAVARDASTAGGTPLGWAWM